MRDRLTARRYAAAGIGVSATAASALVAGPWLTAAAVGLAALISAAATGLTRRYRTGRSVARRHRFALAPLPIAALTWILAAAVILAAPDAEALPRPAHALHGPAAAVTRDRNAASPTTLIDVLVAAAVISSLLAVRTLGRPRLIPDPDPGEALARARAIVERYGQDSLSPFILRSDKSFEFAGGGVLAYRLIRETAVVSADPVGPDGSAPGLLAQFVQRAHRAGIRVAVYGVSGRHLEDYRALGLRALCVGEEAVVVPAEFTLEGRPVRKLRQSVHRVARRGWRIEIREGREIDQRLEAELDALRRSWRSEHQHVVGFAMSLGEFDPGVRPDDVYALAFSPDGQLGAAIRFLAHRDKLSLDTMHRVGDTPNGLNEALVSYTLEYARHRAVPEVSLNYAGLAHLVRRGPSGGWLARATTRMALACLRGHFQMDRLVLFNQKFFPSWRPRYLVYESRAALPRSVLRVLQAEGYLPLARDRRTERGEHPSRPERSSAPLEGGLSG